MVFECSSGCLRGRRGLAIRLTAFGREQGAAEQAPSDPQAPAPTEAVPQPALRGVSASLVVPGKEQGGPE